MAAESRELTDGDGEVIASAYISTQDNSIKVYIPDGWLDATDAVIVGHYLIELGTTAQGKRCPDA